MEIGENQESILDLSIVKEEYIVQADDTSPLGVDNDKIPVNPPKSAKINGKNEPEKKHICAICGKAFRHRRDIRYHVTVHSKERKHRCLRCSKTFTDERRMLTHMRIHADGQHHQCKLCWKTFPVADYLRIHLRRHIGIRNYECEHCGKMFLDNRSRKFHILRFHEEVKNGELPSNRFTCQHCGKISIDNISHELHVVSHSDVRNVECPLCPKKFKHQVHLRYHLTVHRIDKCYVCFICNKAFKTAAQLRQHVIRHQNRIFNCPYCPKTYKWKDTCKRHVWNHHRGLPLDIQEGSNCCTACQQVFDNLDKLKAHVIIHADEKPFQCAICSKDFVDKRKLRTHIRLQHERAEALNKIIHCPQCGKGCRGKTHLFLHQATHADEAQFECAICSKKFKLKSLLTLHLIRHSKNRPLYACKICGVQRTSLRSVRNHESNHKPGEKKLKCPVKLCRRIFNKKVFLNEHIAKSHKELWATIKKPRKPTVKREPGVKKAKERRHICSICGKAFYHPRDVRYHMSIHSTERKFHCPKCPKAFTSHMRMMTHQRLHVDEGGPYPCGLCGKVFQIAEYLKLHLMRHTGENTRECKVCGKKFADLRNLRHHIMRFHEEEDVGVFPQKQFTCDFCGKNCVDKQSYEGHILVHSDVKNVPCPQCPKMFKSEHHVRSHMKVHSDEKPFWCVVCHGAYKNREQFRNHLEARHRGLPVDIKDGPMSCTACYEVFEDLKALKQHILIHAEERPYECLVCGKGFKEKRVLRTHILDLHEREDKPNKILKCPQCGKGCRGKIFLAQHLATHITDALYECAICSKTFKLKSHIRHHVVRHSKERKKYTCKVCGVKLVSLRSHRNHEEKHKLGDKLIKCLVMECKEVFRRKIQMTEHVAKFHEDFRYECKICGAKLKHETYMRQHELNHKKVKKEKNVKIKTERSKDKPPRVRMSKEKRHVCDICKKSFYHRRDVRYHMSIHLTEKKVPCPKCQKLFADQRRMTTHMRIHADGQPHQCKLCSKIFENPEYLRLHLLRHIGANTHECKVCGKEFASSRSLKHHMLRLHDGADIEGLQKFSCDLCEKVFGNRLYLKQHQIVHSNVRNFECPECLKKFKTNDDVRKHMRVHFDRDVKKLVCVICGKAYRNRQPFRAHMRTQHRGIPYIIKDGPISCTACNEVFDDLETLKDHIPIHADDKPYPCPVCEKGFREKRVMRTHLATIHEGKVRKRNLKCPQCGESCLGYHNLAIHQAIHSNIEPFECHFCSRKFISKSNIPRHMLKHSKELRQKQDDKIRKSTHSKTIPIDIKLEIEDSQALRTVIELSDTIKMEI